MISIKTSLASFISIFLAIGAYFIATANLGTEVNSLLPSIFVVLTTVAFFVVTQLQSTQHGAKQSPPRKQAAKSTSQSTNDSAPSSEIATLYIGNLAYKADEQAVKDYFEKAGTVLSVRLVKDKRTGRRKGFGFIEINPGDEKMFIKQLNESEFMERNIIVRPANDKQH